MTDCSGDGFCLMGLQRAGNKYDISNCIHNCMPVKCPNFLVCGSIAPQNIYNLSSGTCFTCKLAFNGKLNISNPEICQICKENNVSVKRLLCEHKICNICYQKEYFNNTDKYKPLPHCNMCDK